MGWIQKISILLLVSFLSLGICQSAAQAVPLHNSELVRVTVHVTIENPEYFWKYPFLGKQLDEIRISGMGKSYSIPSPSDGESVEFEVPKNYKLRVGLVLENNNAIIKEYSFSTKRGADERKAVLHIVLKAPQPQSVILAAPDFDEIHEK
jgi:hypothetical protein